MYERKDTLFVTYRGEFYHVLNRIRFELNHANLCKGRWRGGEGKNVLIPGFSYLVFFYHMLIEKPVVNKTMGQRRG